MKFYKWLKMWKNGQNRKAVHLPHLMAVLDGRNLWRNWAGSLTP